MLWIRIALVFLIAVILVKGGALLHTGELLLSSLDLKSSGAQQASDLPNISTDPLATPNNPPNADKDVAQGATPPEGATETTTENATDSATKQAGDPLLPDAPRTVLERPGAKTLNEEAKALPTDSGVNNTQFNDKQALLDVISRRLEEREAQLKEKQDKVGQLLEQYSDIQDQEIERLVSLYSAMKPKAAAAIFDTMDLTTLLPVVRGIVPRKLAPILAEMDVDRARIVTENLSGRGRDVTTLRQELEQIEREQQALLPLEETEAPQQVQTNQPNETQDQAATPVQDIGSLIDATNEQ